MEALGSDVPKLEFVDLLAGFELFTRTGNALPEETIQYARMAHSNTGLITQCFIEH